MSWKKYLIIWGITWCVLQFLIASVAGSVMLVDHAQGHADKAPGFVLLAGLTIGSAILICCFAIISFLNWQDSGGPWRRQ